MSLITSDEERLDILLIDFHELMIDLERLLFTHLLRIIPLHDLFTLTFTHYFLPLTQFCLLA